MAEKVAIVTGGGQGIGRACAIRLAADGFAVVSIERNPESAAQTAKLIRQAGGSAESIVADLSDHEEAHAAIEQAVSFHGRADALINVVGGAIWWKPYHLFSKQEIMHELDRSLFTTLWCCSAVLPVMVEQGSGTIVNFSSLVVRGGLYRTPYAIAKGGIEAMTRTLASEYGRHGIRVNAVSPGATKVNDRVTSRLTLRPGEEAAPAEDMDSYFAEAVGDLSRLALGRMSEVEEQAGTVSFLVGPDASYVTGQIIQCIGDP